MCAVIVCRRQSRLRGKNENIWSTTATRDDTPFADLMEPTATTKFEGRLLLDFVNLTSSYHTERKPSAGDPRVWCSQFRICMYLLKSVLFRCKTHVASQLCICYCMCGHGENSVLITWFLRWQMSVLQLFMYKCLFSGIYTCFSLVAGFVHIFIPCFNKSLFFSFVKLWGRYSKQLAMILLFIAAVCLVYFHFLRLLCREFCSLLCELFFATVAWTNWYGDDCLNLAAEMFSSCVKIVNFSLLLLCICLLFLTLFIVVHKV